MGSLNVYGVGVATADPELKFVGANDTALATVNLAFNRSFKKNDTFEKEVSFLKVAVWGKRAERFAELVSKGKPVFVKGYVRQENWNAEDGSKRSAITLVLVEWQIVEKFTNGDGNGNDNANSQKANKASTDKPQPAPQEPVPANAGGDEDVPF